MIAYQMTVKGGELVQASLRATPEKLIGIAGSVLDTWAKETAAYVIATKLSGDPLKRRSGNLSRHVHGKSEQTGPLRVSGVVGVGPRAEVPYARIHEFGGSIPAHLVVAKNAQALRIPTAKGIIFRKSAMIPEIDMPKRSYLRTGFAEKAPDGVAELKAATTGGLLP